MELGAVPLVDIQIPLPYDHVAFSVSLAKN